MSNVINKIKLSETLFLAECTDGFWLHDVTRSMNLSMRARSAQDAYVETITYYQERLKEVEREFKELNNKVSIFVESFKEHNNDDESLF